MTPTATPTGTPSFVRSSWPTASALAALSGAKARTNSVAPVW